MMAQGQATQPVKYKDLTAYSETIGAVSVRGVSLQLCDYVEAVGSDWYAMAYLPEDTNEDMARSLGIATKTLPARNKGEDAISIAFVPDTLLASAMPKYDDQGQTKDLLSRLQRELVKLNAMSRMSANAA